MSIAERQLVLRAPARLRITLLLFLLCVTLLLVLIAFAPVGHVTTRVGSGLAAMSVVYMCVGVARSRTSASRSGIDIQRPFAHLRVSWEDVVAIRVASHRPSPFTPTKYHLDLLLRSRQEIPLPGSTSMRRDFVEESLARLVALKDGSM